MNNLATVVYDAAGNLQAAVDPLNHRTTVAYDAADRATAITDALNHTTTLAYDNADNLIAATNPRGFTTSFAYDAVNRLTQSTDALNNLATAVYDAASNLLAQVDPRGNRTTFAYDALNRATQRTDALNHLNTVAYDAAGNVTKSLDALGYATTIAYDALNRQTKVTEPTGGILTLAYDAASNLTASTDQLAHTTTQAFDALNRLTAATDARNFTTTLVYDAASNLQALVDPVANRTTYAYDALNRATQETDPLGKSATVAYDAAARMTSSTDRLGRRIDLTYDNADRLTGQNWVSGGGTINLFTYTYDNADNLLTAANYAGAYTLAYDAIDRATVMQEPFGMALTYSYDAASNRTLMQDSQGGVLTSVYDAVNRLSSRQFGGASQTPVRIDLGYSARDQVTGITRYSDLAGNTKVGESAYTYDAAGLLTNLQHKNGSSSVLANYTYTYDLAHRVVTETYNGTAKNFTYDNTDQLTNDGTNAYSFDGNGNRTMTGYVTGTGNRTTNDGTWTYTYDDQGNLTKKSKGASAETLTYTYDNANRLLGMTDRSTDGGSLLSLATYVYDALSNRLEKDVNAGGTTTVTRFAYDDAGNAWADLNGSSSLTTRRVYLDSVDSEAARISGSTLSFYLPDRLGSIRNMTDSGGVLSNTITYDGFGKVTSETNPSNGDRFKFTGRELDSETGLQFHHARYYDPATGKWTTSDPKGFGAGDPNLYRYVKNGPTNSGDRSGLEMEDAAPKTREDYEKEISRLGDEDIKAYNRIREITEQLKKDLPGDDGWHQATARPRVRLKSELAKLTAYRNYLGDEIRKLRAKRDAVDTVTEQARQGQIRLPPAMQLRPDGSVPWRGRNVDPEVLEQERAGGIGGPMFVMGPDGKLVFIPNHLVNRLTKWELHTLVMREYLRQTKDMWAPGLALDILQGVLDLASFVPLLGNIAAALNGAIAAGRGDGLNAALNFLAILPLLGGVKGAAKAAQELEKAVLAAGKKGKATEDLLAALRILKDPTKLAEQVAKVEQELAKALKSGKLTAAEVEAALVKQGMTKAQAAAKVKELEALAAKNVANLIQDHHAIPWNNKTWNHQQHPLVNQAGNPSLENLPQNLRALEGHIGRHSIAYHREIRRRLDEAYARVAGKGREAAQKELDKVIQGIWDDIASGKLKPYEGKDVILPP